MRIAVGLLAALSAGALASALADPPTDAAQSASAGASAAQAAPAASTAPAAAAATEAAAAKAAAAKADLDRDTQHFLAEGYKPEMRGGEQAYCRKETALGSRLAPVKNCGTIEQLKLSEQQTQSGLRDSQRQQVGTSGH
jgi:hypothetical protein